MERVKQGLVLVAAISMGLSACAPKNAGDIPSAHPKYDTTTTGEEGANPIPTTVDTTGDTTTSDEVKGEAQVVATCETAAKVMVALKPDWGPEYELIDECHYFEWGQQLVDCYAHVQTADQFSPCFELDRKEQLSRVLTGWKIHFTAANQVQADLCYADSKKSADMCAAACDNGFPAACAFVAAGRTDADREFTLQRSCELSEVLTITKPGDTSLTEPQRQVELKAGYDACRVLAAPLFANTAAGYEAATLWSFAGSACLVGGSLIGGSAATACADAAAFRLASESACNTGDQTSCEYFTAIAMAEMYPSCSAYDCYPGAPDLDH